MCAMIRDCDRLVYGEGDFHKSLVSPLTRSSSSERAGFSFRYCQRSVGRLPCVGFSLRPKSRDACAPPIAAWTESGVIEDRRSRGVEIAERRYNPPVRHLEWLYWRAITPKEPLHGPCILAMLVAVAQGQHLDAAQNKGETNRPTYRVRLA